MLALFATLMTLLPAPDGLSAADSLRQEAEHLRHRSDSLKAAWDVMWKRSDSLRIESMLLRMESNKLKRQARIAERKAAKAEEEERARLAALALVGPPAPPTLPPPAAVPPSPEVAADDDPIVEALAERASLGAALQRARSGKVRSGQTLSDTATADVMRVEPDTGVASYYGNAFHGKKTSSGEVYNMWAMTCAHRWLPFGTHLKVTNLRNGKSVVVRVTDRGPFHHGRLIDLSKGAAGKIDMIRAGTTKVEIQVVDP